MVRSDVTLLRLLEAPAEIDPLAPALIHLAHPFDARPVTISRAEFVATIRRLASALVEAGIRRDETVAILAPSVPDALAAFVAAATVAVAFPINTLLAPDAVALQLALARTRGAFVFGPHPDTNLHERAVDVLTRLPEIALAVEIGQSSAPGAWPGSVTVRPWDAMVATGAVPDERSERPAALFHTGGTTGNPRLAELGTRALAAGPRLAAEGIGWRSTDRILNLLPYFHVGGALAVACAALSAGATVITCGVLGARNPDLMRHLWRVVGDHAVTVPAMVPTSWGIVAGALPGDVPRNVRGLATGAAAIPKEIVERLETSMGLPMSQVYGMTELAGFCSAQPIDGVFRAPAVGYPADEIVVRLGPGGEVTLAGPNVFSGYRTREGLVDAPHDGTVRSGDLGEILADGQLSLFGRRKDVIIRGGHNIDPAVIEEVAYRHPGVAAAAAVGMPDAYAGEVPVLYVVLEGNESSEDALRAFVCDATADPPARPKAVFAIDRLPMTPVGKIERYKLRQDAAIRIARGLVDDGTGARIACADPSARELVVTWPAIPTDGTREALDRRLGELGLRAEHRVHG